MLSFVIVCFLVLGGCLLSVAALMQLRSFALYVGFVQYPLGTGCLLLMLGVLNIGTGAAGSIIGGITVGWGALSCAAHMWLRSHGAAVNVPLLGVHVQFCCA